MGFPADLWLALVFSVRNQFERGIRNEARTKIIFLSPILRGELVCMYCVCVSV